MVQVVHSFQPYIFITDHSLKEAVIKMGRISSLTNWLPGLKSFIVFLLLFSFFGCRTSDAVQETDSLVKDLEKKTEFIIQQIEDPLFFDGNFEKRLDSLSRLLDSMNIVWYENIERYRDSIPEKKMNEIEERSRLIIERVDDVIVDRFPGLRLPFEN